MSSTICRNCGHIGEPERKLKGHFLITLILLLCWIIPGVIYMVWRRSGLRDQCSACASFDVVSENSRIGVLTKFDMKSPDTHVHCPDCRELVHMAARKCKHCGSTLTPQALDPIPAPIPSGAELLGRKLGNALRGKKP
jgi:hypothetical protein